MVDREGIKRREPATFGVVRQVAASIPLFERPSNMARLNDVMAGTSDVSKLAGALLEGFVPRITLELATALSRIELPQRRSPDYDLKSRAARLGRKTARDLDEQGYLEGGYHEDWRATEERLGYEIRPHIWRR